jgi:hypothetical protein
MVDKIKTYVSNPDRNKPEPFKPYTPQYKVHGIEPQVQGVAKPMPRAYSLPKPVQPDFSPLPPDNPRAKRAPMRHGYATAGASPIGNGAMPNVGNNMEHSWSSVDGEVFDDLSGQSIDPQHPMIDNNDELSDQALANHQEPARSGRIVVGPPQYQSGTTASNLQPDYRPATITIDENSGRKPMPNKSDDQLSTIVSELEEDSYLLIVSGTPLCSGPLDEIQEQATLFVFGEHSLCEGHPTPLEDIIVIKRVKIKTGLFIG